VLPFMAFQLLQVQFVAPLLQDLLLDLALLLNLRKDYFLVISVLHLDVQRLGSIETPLLLEPLRLLMVSFLLSLMELLEKFLSLLLFLGLDLLLTCFMFLLSDI